MDTGWMVVPFSGTDTINGRKRSVRPGNAYFCLVHAEFERPVSTRPGIISTLTIRDMGIGKTDQGEWVEWKGKLAEDPVG